MKPCTTVLVLMVLAACTAGLLAEEPKLANVTRVFPTTEPAYKRANQYHTFKMRLSPDGKRVLYSRPVAGSEKADDRSARYEIVLRELEGGKEVVLPFPLESGWRNVLTRFNTFDPVGKRLVLPDIKVETLQTGERASGKKMSVKWAIYDIAQGKDADIALEGGSMGPAKFTADGHSMLLTEATGPGNMATKIVSLKDPKAKPKLLTAPGWVQSVSPAGDMAAFFAPPARPAGPPQPGNPMRKPSIRLVLWDLKIDSELAEVPTHPRNSALDDLETQWTPDGRYLYYRDGDETPVKGRQDKPIYRYVTRIWDSLAGTSVGTIPAAMPVGPGPGRLMVLAKDGPGGFLLHDAATGKEHQLGDASKSLIHAYGGKVLYAEKAGDSDDENVFRADIVVPKGWVAATPLPATQSAAEKAQIDRLVKQLGSEKSAEREAAQAALVKIGLPAVAALQSAKQDADKERASRAALAIRQILAPKAPKTMPALPGQ